MFFFSLHKNQFKLHMYFTCGLQRWTIRLFFCSVMCVSAQTGVLSDFVKVLKIRGLDVIDFLKAAGLPHLPLLFGSKHSCDYALHLSWQRSGNHQIGFDLTGALVAVTRADSNSNFTAAKAFQPQLPPKHLQRLQLTSIGDTFQSVRTWTLKILKSN